MIPSMRYIHIYARMNLKFWSFSLNFFPFFKINIIGLCRSISLYVSLMRREKRSFQVRIKVVKADPLFKNELKWKRGESCKYFNRYRLNLKKKILNLHEFLSPRCIPYIYIYRTKLNYEMIKNTRREIPWCQVWARGSLVRRRSSF